MTEVSVARCRVLRRGRKQGARPAWRTVDDHVVAVAGPGTDRGWMLAADVVHVPAGVRLSPEDVFDDLPGCLVVTDHGERPGVRVRGGRTGLDVPTPALAWVVGSVAHAWMVECGGPDTLAEYVASVELTRVREGSPVASVSLLHAGRRSRFVWTAPG